MPEFFLKVASTSDPAAVASAIAHELRKEGRVSVQAVSNEAVGRMTVAVAYATEWLKAQERSVVAVAKIVKVEFDGDHRWGVRFEVEG